MSSFQRRVLFLKLALWPTILALLSPLTTRYFGSHNFLSYGFQGAAIIAGGGQPVCTALAFSCLQMFLCFRNTTAYLRRGPAGSGSLITH
eukprot:1185683-Prorocentrum_minimum.AAC.5